MAGLALSLFLLLPPAAAVIAPAPVDHAFSPVVAIQPLGAMDSGLVDSVTRHIGEMFSLEITVLPAQPLPASAYYAPRSRYRGERVLAGLDDGGAPRSRKILALMSPDLSVTKGSVHDWGVLGVASLTRGTAVVSTHRLGRRRAPRSLVAKRLSRVAVHELGHAFGIRHCPSAGCIMNDAEGSITTVDRSSGSFCSSCRGRLGRVLRDSPLPEGPELAVSGTSTPSPSPAVAGAPDVAEESFPPREQDPGPQRVW